jgi:sulfoxide reductase heme-binding subunit YedZ
MSATYRAVGWTRQKKVYDAVLACGVVSFVALFAGVGALIDREATIETLLLRAFALCALVLLHVILSIGPLARLDPRFLPLLYNRRHLGVTFFALVLAHVTVVVVQFGAGGDANPLASVLGGGFGFEWAGAGALLVFFLMAATSHDFWLSALTPPVWKTLHMTVYAAYALVVAHVAFGALAEERSPALLALLAGGMIWLVTLHLLAARREEARDRDVPPQGEWVRFGAVEEIPEGRARTACVAGERVAVFRWEGKLSALSSVCRHQGGPLGEGRVLDGCVTCPWHGYQYLPDSGVSPPPFTEKVPTFRLRVEEGIVWVDPRPNPPGTFVAPIAIGPESSHARA